jgi:hypothetical protein
MNDQKAPSTGRQGGDSVGTGAPDPQGGGGQETGTDEPNQEQAEKTQILAELAGGGSNKGSNLGSNEDLDQAGQGNRPADDR